VSSLRLQLQSNDAASHALELHLPADTRGENRSAAEGAKLLRRAPASALTLRLEPNDFSACGAEQCWREPPPPELTHAPRACRP